MIKQEFYFTKKNGNKIAVCAFIPEDGTSRYPTVLFSHGFGSNYRELMHHGDGFTENGLVCIFFDFCGGGMDSMSDGKMTDMTVLSEIEDLSELLNYVLTLSYVDENHIYLQGESMGGFVSAYVAAQLPNKIKGLVLWYPAFIIPDDSRTRIEQNDNTCFGIPLSPSFNTDAISIDIYSEIKKYHGPVKLIHGDKDPVVPLSYSIRAQEIYENVSLTVIPNAGHGFHSTDSRYARELSIFFIKDNLCLS